MKLNTIFLTLSLLFIVQLLAAKTWRVNNTPNTDPDFTNLTDAYAAAREGDTLYIEGSATSYGSLTMTKRLVLIGPGYYLSENPNTPPALSARLQRLTLEPSAPKERNTGAAGSRVIGLDFGYSSISSTVLIYVNDVQVRFCRTYNIGIQNETSSNPPATGTQIFQNRILGSVTYAGGNTGPNIDVQVFNNVVEDISFQDFSTGLINHNTIIEDLDLPNFNGELRSNVLVTANANAINLPTLPNPMVSHNTAANSQFGDVNENNTRSPATLFVGEANNSNDGQWQLRPDAPIKGTAHDGTDRGAFGGNTPYSLSGQGSIPVITFLQVQPTATQGEKLSVRIRAISGN